MKILNGRILIKGTIKMGKIARLDNPKVKNTSEIEKLEVIDLADNVKIGVKIGDSVVVDPEALANVGFCVNLLFPKKNDDEFYVLVEEKHILVVRDKTK